MISAGVERPERSLDRPKLHGNPRRTWPSLRDARDPRGWGIPEISSSWYTYRQFMTCLKEQLLIHTVVAYDLVGMWNPLVADKVFHLSSHSNTQEVISSRWLWGFWVTYCWLAPLMLLPPPQLRPLCWTLVGIPPLLHHASHSLA